MRFSISMLIWIYFFSVNPVFLNAKISVGDIVCFDGSILRDLTRIGQIDFTGYHVKLDPKLGPVFLSAPPLAGWNPLGPGLNDIVYAIAIDGNNVYVGGEFQAAGGNPDANWIAHWDGSSWNALGTGFNNPVLERVHIFQVKTSLKFFDKSEKKIRTLWQLLLIAS